MQHQPEGQDPKPMGDSVFALLAKSRLECYPIQLLWLILLFPHFQLIMEQLVIGAPYMLIEFKRQLSREAVDPSVRIGFMYALCSQGRTETLDKQFR